MAKEDEIVLKLRLEEAKSKVNIKKFTSDLNELDGRTKEYKLTVAKLNLEEQKLANTRQKLSKATSELIGDGKKGLTGVSDATGAATSATLELGRAISDAPYGIRGVANNLSQFASQFSFMSNKVDDATGKVVGFSGALKGLGQAIKANAILLLIQIGIAAFDKFAGGAKKAEKAVTDLTKETYASSLVANQYVKELENVNLTEERRKIVTQELIKLVPTLKEEDLKYGENLDDVKLKIKQYTLAQASRIEMDKLVQENSALLSKQMRVDLVNSTEDQEEKVKIIKGLLKEEGIELEKLVNKSYSLGQKNLTLRKKTNTELIEDFKELAKEIEEESKPILEKIDNLSKGLSLDPSKDTGDVFKGKFIESYYNEIAGLEEIIKDEDFDEISDSAKIEGELVLKPKLAVIGEDKLDIFIKNYKVLMSGINDLVSGEFDRQLTIEQNKTNALNEELNNRLLNESLSADQRKNIQNEIAQNDEKLRVKQEAIKKKQFKQQKAFNISMAVISTYSAAAKVLDDTKGGSFARIAGMVAVIGAGLAQVAAISRQKYQSSSANTPIRTSGGASGGATERAEPSFNIVGRSNDNLLINAIQAQFGKPLKAYVVSRDVTTQQQLDGMIVGQAGT